MSEIDDALDRLEALSGPSDSIRGKALATVRSELERLRKERDELACRERDAA